jgi:hypothetical protein
MVTHAFGPQPPTNDLYGLVQSRCKNIQRAFGNVASGAGNGCIAVVGDSTDAGIGDVAGNTRFANSWPNRLAGLLTSFGINASASSWWGQYDNATISGAYTFDPRVVTSGSFVGYGYGRRCATASCSLAFTPANSVDTVDIYYWRDPSQAGAFSVTFGSTTQAVNAVGTAGLIKVTITASNGAAVQAITCTQTSGALWLQGMVAYNSAVKEIAVVNMGRTGWKASDWVGSGGIENEPKRSIPVLNPDVAIVGLTINDASTGTSLATYTANLQSIRDWIVANAVCDVFWR